MNWVADLFDTAATSEGWARWQRPTSDNPIIPREELEAARRDMGELQFAQEHLAQFVTAGSGMFKVEWMERRYEALGESYRLPDGRVVTLEDLRRFATVDLAVSTRTTADYSVVAVFGLTSDDLLLLLDLRRARLEGPDLVPWLRTAQERWQLSSLWIEKTGFQLALLQQAAREGLPVREIRPDRDKVSRALPATAAMESGRLLLPRTAPWVRDLIAELLSFPHGRHDDQVDALAYGVAVLHEGLGTPAAWTSRRRREERRTVRIFPVTPRARGRLVRGHARRGW